jgi:hypothetical protein
MDQSPVSFKLGNFNKKIFLAVVVDDAFGLDTAIPIPVTAPEDAD